MIYIFLFLMLGYGSLLLKKNYSWFFFGVVFLFSAIRFDVGKDYLTYYTAIVRNTHELDRFDPGILAIVKIAQNTHYQVFFIITSLLIIGLTSIGYQKLSKHFFISSILFLSVPVFFIASFSIVRQFVAMSIVLAATPYIFKRNPVHFYACVIIAYLFHKTAILAVPLYFVYLLKPNRIFLLAITGFALVGERIMYLLVKILLPSYLKYLELNYGDDQGGQMNMFMMVLFCLFFIIFKEKTEKDRAFNFYFSSFLIGTCIYAMLNKYGHAGMRGSLYYTMYLPLLYPYYLNLWPKKIKPEVFAAGSFILFFLIYLITVYIPILKGAESSILPYRVFFLNN